MALTEISDIARWPMRIAQRILVTGRHFFAGRWKLHLVQIAAKVRKEEEQRLVSKEAQQQAAGRHVTRREAE